MKQIPYIVITHKKKSIYGLQEIIKYKDLLYFMILRDFSVMYKQSILGYGWVFINPIFSVVLFSIVFGKLANVPHEQIPYPIFSYAALIPWIYFSSSVLAASNSLISNSSIFTKVYFPRLILPLTPIFSKLIDLSLSFILLIGMMIYYHYSPTIKIFLIPLLLVIIVVTAIGLGTLLSALALQFRDIRFAITFLMPLLMYAAPVVFPASLVQYKLGNSAYLFYGLYPMTGIIEGFRAAIVTTKPIPWDLIGMSSLGAILIFMLGIVVFKKMENSFAEVA